MTSLRSYLYVPGDQPRKLARAATRGADALIIDLEDAVSPGSKDVARRIVGEWLDAMRPEDSDGLEVWVRVNQPGPLGEPPVADLRVAVHPRVAGIVAAKTEPGSGLRQLDDAISEAEVSVGICEGSIAVSALVESATALAGLSAIATAPRIVRLQLGEADLAAELGMAPGPECSELLPIRVAVVIASASAGLDRPVGPVYAGLRDPVGLRRSSELLRRLGFVGRAILHPTQVDVVHDVFTPDPAEVAAAAALIERFETAATSGVGVITTEDGSVVDAAAIRSARSTVRRAERAQVPLPSPSLPWGTDE